MRQRIAELKPNRERGEHAGLLLQRYLTVPVKDAQQRHPDERKALLSAAVAATIHANALYAAAFCRWRDSFDENATAVSANLRTRGRLIVGLGSQNVLETGLRLHHIYGTPLIPGSALKGLASHYCDQEWRASDGEFRIEGKYHKLIFGAMEDGGVIVFHDAWIMPDSLSGALKRDVMTPHHPKWQDGSAPPTDFDSPVPVSYLSVTGTFHVIVSWRGPNHDEARKWTELSMTLLKEALREWGIGGKTSSGYGRLDDANAPASNVGKPTKAAPPKPATRVEAVLLEERTRKGGWRARYELAGLEGPIQNSNAVPADKKPGDKITLNVAFANEREIAFRYDAALSSSPAISRKGKK